MCPTLPEIRVAERLRRLTAAPFATSANAPTAISGFLRFRIYPHPLLRLAQRPPHQRPRPLQKPPLGHGPRHHLARADYHAKGVLYLPEEARFGHLLQLPEGGNIRQAVNNAMRAAVKENPDLADVLPKTFQILENRTLAAQLKVMTSIPMDKGGDRRIWRDWRRRCGGFPVDAVLFRSAICMATPKTI